LELDPTTLPVIQLLDVELLLSKCDPGGSPGPDGLHPRILRECARTLALPLTHLFNSSLKEGKVPSIWSKATVCPFYKSGARHHPDNYRPISLTSIPCKILEKLVKRSLYSNLENSNFFHPAQHGFLPGRSCLSNLLPFLDEVSNAIDRGRAIHCIYFDMSKAFDKLSHKLMASTLHDSGIRGTLLQWIISFLSNRTIQVRIGDSYSSPAAVTSGVPQGSVLGPILFLIFINKLPSVLPTSSAFYADDFKIWSDDPAILQDAIDKCVQWTQSHGLQINPTKTVHISYNCRNPPSFFLHSENTSTTIATQAAHKDLGVWSTSSLSPSLMCAKSAKKGNMMLNFIRRALPHITPKMFQSIYATYIRPQLEYCSIAWLPILKKDQHLLEQVQRRATKVVRQIRSLPYSDRLSALNLFPLDYRRLRGCLIYTYKLFQNGSEGQYFTLSDTGLRGHNKKLFVERVNTRLRQSFFSYVTVPLWNKLPQEVIEAPSLQVFKLRLDKTLPTLLEHS
jgi:hypothetical protein